MKTQYTHCYSKTPIRYENEIPVFSDTDFYVSNYDKISGDHIEQLSLHGNNPFMDEEHWEDIESSTAALIRKFFKKDTKYKLLDVGVGLGRLLDKFPEQERYGMDISMEYLLRTKQKGIDVCMSKLEEIPYRDEYFDAVITTDVLEHVLDLNKAIEAILKVLKSNGLLFVRVPYRENLSGYLKPDYPYELVHLRNFDESSLVLLFEKIFNVEVLEWNLTGYKAGAFKFSSNRYYVWFMRGVFRGIKTLNKSLFEFLCKKLRYPTEINLVVKKSKLNQNR